MELLLDHDNASRALPAVPRRVRIAAYAVPLCVLPSALWRVGHVVKAAVVGPGPCDTGGLGAASYMVLLSAVSVGGALLTLGLVQPWGERVPDRVAWIGGRDVPARAATVAALTGAGVVALITVYAFTKDALGIAFEGPPPPPGCEPPGLGVGLLYLPLPAWAPLLFFVALHYKRRRGVRLLSRSPSTNDGEMT